MKIDMSGIKVNFEIGHEASVRSKKTPEGFTHDWEVFVRGQEGADISHFVDKVVFHLHSTFPKPRRVVKEPPFSIKESGYAGFVFPIEIYLKNKDEPKKIKFSYDFTLQQSGFLKDRYIFPNPNEDFRKKLLKGGGIAVTNNAFYTNPDQESRSRDSFTEEKQQLVGKPKLSSENVKKHKTKELKDEIPHRTSSFENLFGPPIQKPSKVSPDPKKLIDKTALPTKSDKKEKDRSNSSLTEKKSKYEHKESKPDKVKMKEDKEKIKQEKIKNYKEQEKTKDKAMKRPSERPLSPEIIKKRLISPKRQPSPPPRSSSASSMKEEYKIQKHPEPEPKKPKPEEKPPEPKPDKEQKEKKKKEKKSHDRDKERKERKEHKKENHKRKDSPVNKELSKEIPKEMLKARDTPKEKEPLKDTTPVKEKHKQDKAINKFSLENLQKTPPSADIEERPSNHKSKEKSDSERKHKHKKKDKKRDESKEKHKESSKEKKHKHEKVREVPVEKPEVLEHRETPISKEHPPQELGSPISIDTASQCSSKSGLAKTSHVIDDINSCHSDSEISMIADDDDKPKLNHISPEPIKEPSPEPEPEREPEPQVEHELEAPVEAPPAQPKEKSKKHKDKSSKREEKRRKRKAAEEEEGENRKVAKTAESPPAAVAAVAAATPGFIKTERGESSGSVTETKVQDNGVSSSLGEDAEPGDLSPDYMVQLRDLQQRIMKIKNNEDLERVVNLIAETGRYEVTTQTFDFDLCLLDRSTVQQLIQLVGC